MAKKIDPAVDKELKAIRKLIQDQDKKILAWHNELIGHHNDQDKRFVALHNEQEKSRAAGIDSLQKQIQDLDKKYAAAINARH